MGARYCCYYYIIDFRRHSDNCPTDKRDWIFPSYTALGLSIYVPTVIIITQYIIV